MTNADVHLFGNDPEGIALVQQLQQRAEAWAEAGILTMIFTTDDYWPYETMKKNASRLRVSRKVLVLLRAIQSSLVSSLRYLFRF
jgi:dihydroorotase-like cyclic amidohydrolase